MTGPISPERRRAILSEQIQEQARHGYRIESESEFQAVMVKGHRPNHILHLLLTVLTLGLWVVVWISVVIWGGERRRMIVVDEYGR